MGSFSPLLKLVCLVRLRCLVSPMSSCDRLTSVKVSAFLGFWGDRQESEMLPQI
jgi:hypothetical protein